jgi:hypothetical protein
MDKKEVLLERNKISRLLGTETEDGNLERNIFLLKSLDMQKDIAGIIGKVYALIKEGQEDTQALKDVKNEIRVLVEALDKYQEAFDKEVKVFVSNFPDALREVRVSNTEDFRHEHPKEIRVSNLKEIKPEKHPDEISIKRPVWYKEFDFDKLFKFSKDSSAGFFNQVKANIFNSFIRNVKPKEAIPVRLVTEDGEKFYRAGNVFVGGGGGIDPVGVKNIVGTKINPAAEDGNLAGVKANTDKIPADPAREGGILQTIDNDIKGTQPRDVAKRILKKTIALSASGIVHTPATNKKISLFSVKFSLSADMTDVSFRWTAGGADFEKYLAPKTGGLYGANNHPDYIEGAVDQPLYCNITGSGNVQVNIDYLEI